MSDLYQSVTNDIIAALEAGTPPWIKPWVGEDDGLPANLVTGRAYRGINVLLLNLQTMARGYSRCRWLTFKQAQSVGANIRKGESGSPIVFFKMQELPDAADASPRVSEGGGADKRVIPLLRSFTVFNVDQCENLPASLVVSPDPVRWRPVERAQAILDDSKVVIRHGGSMAYYLPLDDTIHLPPLASFASADAYYGTALHELTHWTGHSSRLNRSLGKRHGIDAYAFEELVAEMGAAFLCAHSQIPGHLRHASYLASWLTALKNDKRLIFTAASKAQQAADLVLGTAFEAPSPVTELAERIAA